MLDLSVVEFQEFALPNQFINFIYKKLRSNPNLLFKLYSTCKYFPVSFHPNNQIGHLTLKNINTLCFQNLTKYWDIHLQTRLTNPRLLEPHWKTFKHFNVVREVVYSSVTEDCYAVIDTKE